MTPQDLFEILVRENAEMLTVYLRSHVRDSNTADDLFQETMLTAWKKIGQYDRTRPFGPWLRGIAAKLALAQRRKSARGFMLCDEETLDFIDSQLEAVQQRTGDTLDQKLDGLRDCLDHLPEHYRDPIRLRYTEELTPETLAERLEISLETVKKRLQRGRVKLLECLQSKLALAEVR